MTLVVWPVVPTLPEEARVTTPNGAPATAMQPVELEGPGDVRFAMSAEREGEHLVISRSLRVPLGCLRACPRTVEWAASSHP